MVGVDACTTVAAVGGPGDAFTVGAPDHGEVCLRKCTSWGSKYPTTGGCLQMILS